MVPEYSIQSRKEGQVGRSDHDGCEIEEKTTEWNNQTCPECNSSELAQQSDEVVCMSCGLVIKSHQITREFKDQGLSWGNWGADSHTDAPPTNRLHDKGLTTRIGSGNRDGYGREITDKQLSKLQTIRKWQSRFLAHNASEENLQYANNELERMASALGIPNEVREIASVIYRRALDEDLLRGRSIEVVITASLYAACRQSKMARTFDEVEAVSRVEHQNIPRAYRCLVRELGLKIEPAHPKSYLPRFASELDLGHEVSSQAEELLDTYQEAGLASGKSPPGLAASALYGASLICDEKRTQSEIEEVTEIAEETIRKRYKELFETVGISPSDRPYPQQYIPTCDD